MNVATGGGIAAAISLIVSSGIGPGPLGIFATRPIAEAPKLIAISASFMFLMQQIFIRVIIYMGKITGCWLLVAGCWLLVTGCWLLVAGCWLLVTGCWLLVAGCWLEVSWSSCLPHASACLPTAP
jgi:uncharacterized membrane protein